MRFKGVKLLKCVWGGGGESKIRVAIINVRIFIIKKKKKKKKKKKRGGGGGRI